MPDPPFPQALGMPFIEVQSVDSTNNYARQLISSAELPGWQDGALHGATVFAHEQFAGKGQRGKNWTSQKDANIIMSMVILPHTRDVSRQFELSACIAVSVREFFAKYAGDETRIKWPNDLYWQDRKAGGILIESGISGLDDEKVERGWLWSIAGIGINVNQVSFPEWLPNPVSLKQITGKSLNSLELAKELCAVTDSYYRKLSAEGFESIYDLYNAFLYKRGARVRLRKESRVFEATILEVTRQGKLLVSHAIEEEFNFGEIELIP